VVPGSVPTPIPFMRLTPGQYLKSESIECIIDFSRPYDLAPSPPPYPVSKFSLFLSLPRCLPPSLLGGGGGERTEAKSYDGEKAWSSIVK
jgi:hypothetical protein